MAQSKYEPEFYGVGMYVKTETYFKDLTLDRLAGVTPDPEDAREWRGVFIEPAPEQTADSSS